MQEQIVSLEVAKLAKEKALKHPQLEGLKAVWKYPEEMLNKILWVNSDDIEAGKRELAIGHASKYIDYMEAVCGTDNPAEAWEDWCISNDMEHEINNNPYL